MLNSNHNNQSHAENAVQVDVPLPLPGGNHPLTDDIKRQLRQIAKALPAMTADEQPKMIEVDGATLLERGHKFIKKNGETKPIIAGKTYVVPDSYYPVGVSVIQRLFQFYKASGIVGVMQFLAALPDHHEKMKVKYPDSFRGNEFTGGQ